MNKPNFINSKYLKIIIGITIFILTLLLLSLISKTIDNKNPIFKIEKIILYSNVNVSTAADRSLNNLSIGQYSDILLYINNQASNSTISKQNTIKKLYIDDIKIKTNTNNRESILLNYKNPLDFGKAITVQHPTKNKITFNIINNNQENNNADYTYPTFYTDCSNPITLSYLHNDIVQNFSAPNNNIVTYNTSVLKNTDISLEDLKATLSFTIHIVSNANRKYSCKTNIDISFDEDFFNNGYSYTSLPLSEDTFVFHRE